MPSFSYKAQSFKGEIKTGIAEAKNKYELARSLRKEGYVLISASSKGKKKKLNIDVLNKLLGVPLKEKLFFTRNLRLMIAAGVSLPQALETLKAQTDSPRFKKILGEVREMVLKGKSFSKALRAYPDVFSELFCSMVEIGEETGNLQEVLKNLTNQMSRVHELKSKVKGAMIYPAVIVAAMMGIGILMLVLVVPKLAETFDELGIDLPFTTRIVIFLGNTLVNWWFLFPILAVVIFLFFKLTPQSKSTKKLIDKILLRVPVISSIVKKTNISYTARTLSALIASGVPLVRSLKIISKTLGNFYFREAILEAARKVKKGDKLSESLEPYQEIYSLTFIQMIAVGEETGSTEEVLSKLADFTEQEVIRASENLAAVIEPILMIVVGAAVGFFAISMIQPMYSMLGGL